MRGIRSTILCLTLLVLAMAVQAQTLQASGSAKPGGKMLGFSATNAGCSLWSMEGAPLRIADGTQLRFITSGRTAQQAATFPDATTAVVTASGLLFTQKGLVPATAILILSTQGGDGLGKGSVVGLEVTDGSGATVFRMTASAPLYAGTVTIKQ